ncbi:MAG: hypothetical protein JSU66_17370 [Deltaproteobacteria bacterium]|nr:MAG: hypothetical protein JSU66_17370 [Deltaproteobacteria bacterium]
MSSSRVPAVAVLALAGLLSAAPSAAQEGRQIRVHLIVVHASQTPGPIDPDAKQLHEQLQRDFRYRSLRVMQHNRLRMPMREERRVELPTGRALRVRPIALDPQGILMSLEMQDRLDTRVMLRPRKPVVIGGERYQDGKLFIAIESDD